MIFGFSACVKFSAARNIFSVNMGPCKIYDDREEEINEYLQLRLISVYLNLNGSVRKIVKNCRTFLNFFARGEENGGQRRVNPYAFDACHNFFSIKTIMLAQLRKMSDDDAT